MKLLCSLFLLSFSVNAFATGSFHCTGKIYTPEGTTTVHLEATTGRVEGNPMVGNLRVAIDGPTDYQFEVPKERIVGYWNGDNFLLLNAANDNYTKSEIKFNYNTEYKKGVLKMNTHGIHAITKKVSCIME